jgi:hypothetical protein
VVPPSSVGVDGASLLAVTVTEDVRDVLRLLLPWPSLATTVIVRVVVLGVSRLLLKVMARSAD